MKTQTCYKHKKTGEEIMVTRIDNGKYFYHKGEEKIYINSEGLKEYRFIRGRSKLQALRINIRRWK